jgi:opacity protein-like surface antigen
MNKKAAIGPVLAFIVLFGAAEARSQIPGEKFSLRISAGYGFSGFGDVNMAEKGHNARFADLADSMGFDKTGELALPHQGLDFNGEIVLRVAKPLEIGIGLGRLFRAKNDSMVAIEESSSGARSFVRWTTKATATPLLLNAYYRLSISPRLSGFIKAGLGYYIANLELATEKESELLGIETWSRLISKGRDYALGYQAGLGIEYGISGTFSLFAEGGWRFVNFKNWSITYDYASNSLTDTTRTAMWWSVEELNRDTGKFYPGLVYSDQEPAGAIYEQVRKAEIDFSGWTIQLGLKIRLGKSRIGR